MKAPDIVEAWKWKDPQEIIERLMARSKKENSRAPSASSPASTQATNPHRAAAARLFRKDPEIRRKSEDPLQARRRAAMRAAEKELRSTRKT